MPTIRGRNQLDAASGTMPRRANTRPKRAFGRREPHVHRQLHRHADADRRPVDRADHRLQALEDPQRDEPAAVAVLLLLALGVAERVAAARQVGAGAEAAARRR